MTAVGEGGSPASPNIGFPNKPGSGSESPAPGFGPVLLDVRDRGGVARVARGAEPRRAEGVDELAAHARQPAALGAHRTQPAALGARGRRCAQGRRGRLFLEYTQSSLVLS